MEYAGFISYSHADAQWASWLLRKLESYRVPSRLVGTTGAYGVIGPRLGKFFRDRDELPTAGDLGETIRRNLRESAALVVLCSPAAAQSRWVNAEVESFRAQGRDDRIACFIVDGDPGDNASPQSCFPPAVVAPGADGVPREPLAADARKQGDGRERAFVKLVAGLLGISYDALAQREAHRKQRRLLAVTIASLVGMGIAIGLAATAYIARNDAQRRQAQAVDIMGFMMGDLRDKLAKVGRLDLMSSVDDKATEYFATLPTRDLSDATLEQQARSLTRIGEVRLEEGRHDAAMAAFREALARSSALAERAPTDGQRLYDRAQAEYWIGFVGLQQGDYATAERWLTRYRDSAMQLAKLDPRNFDWQKEVAYGLHNLAVMEQRRGRYAQAEASIRKELALYAGWVQARPRDLDLRFEASDSVSWLASLSLSQGKLADAEQGFARQVAMLRQNIAAEPDNMQWKGALPPALLFLADVRQKLGDREGAQATADDCTALATALAGHDPANNKWRIFLGRCHLAQASVAAQPDPARAARLAAAAESLLTTALSREPKSTHALGALLTALNASTGIAFSRDDVVTARRKSDAAIALAAPAWRHAKTEPLRLRFAEALIRLALLAERTGDASVAATSWRQAQALLTDETTPDVAFARAPFLLQTQTALGDPSGAARSRALLQAAGFRPLDALPTNRPVAAK